MNDTNSLNIKNIELLNDLSEKGLEKIRLNCKILSYELGQIVTRNKEIPNQILIILNGNARLTVNIQEQITTLIKLGKESVI